MFLTLLASETKKQKRFSLKIQKSTKLPYSSVILYIVLSILFSSVKLHIIDYSEFDRNPHTSEIPFHECVHDEKIKEIVGDSIMIHEPTEEELNQEEYTTVIESDGFESNSQVNLVFLYVISFYIDFPYIFLIFDLIMISFIFSDIFLVLYKIKIQITYNLNWR